MQLTDVINRLGLAWWVEIKTTTPACTYYFGPFMSSQEAKVALPGYVEDLEREQAQGIVTAIKRCKPSELTITDEADESVIVVPHALR
jgi:hypothetical protein